MIGRILSISDDNDEKYIDEAKEIWAEHGFRIDSLSFEDAYKDPNLQEYYLIAFTMKHEESAKYHEYARFIREKTKAPLVFFPYEATSASEKISFLESGADDVIDLPVNMDYAITKCMALIRHNIASSSEKSDIILFDDHIVLDVNRYIVIVDKKEIKLRNKECEILYYLMQNRNVVKRYDQIYSNVWGDEYIGSSREVLWNHIKRLRKKLQWNPELPEFIITTRDIGYSFAPTYKK